MLKKIAAGPTRDALYARLNGKLTYGGVAVPSFDGMAQQGTTGRWVAIEEVDDSDASTKNSFGRDVRVELGIWSPYLGTLEVDAIAEAIVAMFAATPLVVPGFKVSVQESPTYEVVIDDSEEPIYRHGILTYELSLYQTS